MAKSNSQKSRAWMIALRVTVILLIVSTVIPPFNPARMSGLINKNSAFITMAISYSTIFSEFTRPLKKGWVESGTLNLVYISSLLVCINIVVITAGCCMSLGKKRLQKLGTVISPV